MISGYGISTTDIFSRRVVSMNASIYQVNRGKLHIAKNQKRILFSNFFFTILLFFHAYISNRYIP